jgi:glutathione S-transferase
MRSARLRQRYRSTQPTNFGLPTSDTTPLPLNMITVHHLNNSRSQRILWLLEELDLEYDIKRYKRDPQTLRAPASLRKIHPLGKSPVITDGELTIAESGAIIEYLIAKYDRGLLIPSIDSPDRLRYNYWLHFAEGSAMPPLLIKTVFGQIETSPMPFFVRPFAKLIASQAKNTFIEPEITQNLDYMEAELQKSQWFAGDNFTAADIQMSFPIEAAAAQGAMVNHPLLSNFLQRIHARPAYNYALERGGTYDLAFA